MKFCSKCGTQLPDDADFCSNCGARINNDVTRNETVTYASNNTRTKKSNSALRSVALAFMIISTVIYGFLIIPLAWMLPMTLKYNDAVSNKRSVGVGFKICSLLFVSAIAGILMLCDDD